MREINNMSRGMSWRPQTGVTQYHAQLGLPDKGRAIKGLVVCLQKLGSRASDYRINRIMLLST